MANPVMRTSNHIDEIDVFRMVKNEVDRCGGETKFAERAGVSRQFVHQVMSSKCSMPPRFLALAGIRRVVTVHYEMVEGEGDCG